MTEGRRCHDYDRLHPRICNHCAVIAVHGYVGAGECAAAASAAESGQDDARHIVYEMLDVTAAVSADADEAYSQFSL